MKRSKLFDKLPIWIERELLVCSLFFICILVPPTNQTHAQITDIEYLIDRLDANEIFTRQAAIDKLAEIGEPAFPYLASTLKRGKPVARSSAIRVLSKIGHSAIPILSIAVKDPTRQEQKDPVLGVRKDPVPDTQKEAIESLRDFGFPVLIVPLLTHGNSNVRRDLAYALGEMAKSVSARDDNDFREVVPALVQALDDQNREVQLHAINALGKMKGFARTYKDTLQKMFSKFQFSIAHRFRDELEEGNDFILPFSMPLDLRSELDLGVTIPPELLEQFTLSGIPISDKVTLATQKKHKSWIISDDGNKQIYTLKRTNEDIDVHRTSISRNLQLALEEKGLYVSRKARIDQVTPKRTWLLIDRNQIYTVEYNPPRIDFSLNHEDPEIRTEIVEAMVQILAPSEIGEYLIKMLDDPNRSVSGAAARAMSKVTGKGEEKLVKELIDRLRSKVSRSQFYAAVALGKIKAYSATGELLKMLKDDNHANDAIAADVLGQILDQDPQIPAILPKSDNDQNLANEPDHKKIVEALVETLKHENFIVRLSVVETLGKIGKSAKSKDRLLLTKNLIGLLSDSNLQVRQKTALALGKIKEPAELIVSQLTVSVLKDYDVRTAAITALGEIGQEAERAMPTVKEALNDSSGEVRASAVRAIVKISQQNKEDDVLNQVRRILDQDINEDVKAAAALALADFHSLSVKTIDQIKADKILSALVRSLGDPSQKVQVNTIEALKRIGSAAAPTLLDAQKSTNHRIVRNTAIVLADIGTQHSAKWGTRVLQLLFKLSKDKEADYHRKIIDLLKGFDKLAKLNFLKEKLNDEIIDDQIHSAYLLGEIKEPPNEIIPILIETLESSDPHSTEEFKVFVEAHRALLNFRISKANEALIKERVRAWRKRKTQRQQKTSGVP